MTREVDTLVVGAGPAGSAAAITLARAGQRVLVVDKATFPRDKICGDGLTAGALRHLEALGLDPTAVPSWQAIDDVVIAPPWSAAIRFPLPRGPGAHAVVARRRELDAALVTLARGAGAEVREGHALHCATDDGDHVHATIDGIGAVRARHTIGADGMWSPLRKTLGLGAPGYRGELHAFRQYLRGTGPAAGDLHIWFEPDFLPGYAWSFPLADGAVNVGFAIERGGKVAVREMAEIWRGLWQRPRIAEVLGDAWEAEGPHRAWPIPAQIDRVTLGRGRALFVGDAAAAADPMSGEGIGQALDTGISAAEAILAHGPHDPRGALAAYERRTRSGMARDSQMAALVTRALRHRKGAEAAVRVVGATDWTRRRFGRWLFEDYPRALVVTPHRWRRGAMSGPGAFGGAAPRPHAGAR